MTVSTHSRAEQQQWINRLRDALDNLPPAVPDAILDDIQNLAVELMSFNERLKPGPKAPMFVHARDRE